MVEWLAGALQRHHGFPEELQDESQALLAFVFAGQDDKAPGETDSVTKLLDHAWVLAQTRARDLAKLLEVIENGESLCKPKHSKEKSNAAHSGDPPGPDYPEALRAVIFGQIPELLTRHVETWLHRVNPVSGDLTVPQAQLALKQAFSREVSRHPGPDADAELSLRLHNYCRNFLAETLRAEKPDLDAIWETLERGRLALCVLEVKPLPESALESTWKLLYAALDQLEIVPGRAVNRL